MRVGLLVALFLAALIQTAADNQGKPAPVAALGKLEFLLGDWKTHGKVLPGPFGPAAAETEGTASYKLGPGGLWLLFHSQYELPGRGTYEVQGEVTVDPQSGKVAAWAFNNLAAVMIEYDGKWTDEHTLVFTGVRESARGTIPRLSYTKLPDGRVRFVAAESADGSEFCPYFEAVLERAKPAA